MKTRKGLLALETPAKEIGSVKRRKDSQKLYVDFYYFGHRIIRSTELNDTPANERKVRDFLSRISERIETGTFKFAEAFPGATRKEKAFFTSLEGREYRPEPHQVLFGEYVKEWQKTIFPTFGSPTKHRDYQESIKRILPYFRNMTFHQITGQELFRFNSTDFAKVWKKAVDQAGITPMTSYIARHSFAAWCLTIGINPLRLVKLMGHASKQMVYEVYGNYVEGLEADAEAIFNYFGEDFLTPRKKENPILFRYSTGHSRGVNSSNLLTPLSF